jgi:hypothetical protein
MKKMMSVIYLNNDLINNLLNDDLKKWFVKRAFFGRGGDWSVNSRLCPCKVGASPLEPLLRSILLWLFWRWGLTNYLPRLISSLNPPDLSLPRT